MCKAEGYSNHPVCVSEGYSYYGNHPICVCMCVFVHVCHLIPETTRFCYPDKLSVDGRGCVKGQNYKDLL